MKNRLIFWQIVGFIFVSIAGTLLHFLYDWCNQSIVVAFVSAVNESIWEHMKLLFVPLTFYAIFEYRFLKQYSPNFWCIKLLGTIVGLAVIPLLYYTYTGILGVSADWFNIAIFYIAAAISFLTEIMLFKQDRCKLSSTAAIAIWCFIGLSFVVFTVSPPKIPLFRDPLTGLYGR